MIDFTRDTPEDRHILKPTALLTALGFIGVILASGCASMRTAKYDPLTGKLLEESRTFVFAQRSALKGFSTFKVTKTGSSAISITQANNETQAEVITGSAEALGVFAGTALKTAK